ncbi:alanine racemase [Mesorhizobium sp. VNQ89]|uniref:alanine racemase n=1 Tax=Mesorhizobium quangtriensis TaxID=3157709 RepID=UPI0032B80F71
MAVPSTPSDSAATGAILTIDLQAIRDNYRRLGARLSGAECAAVVKADGYGLGAADICNALASEGCRAFFVAHPAEALELRTALGPQPDIYILNGVYPGAEEACARAGLIAVANSTEQLLAWQAASRRHGPLPVAIQVDSGMSRLGMAPSEVRAIAPSAFDGLDLRLVMSHLACADEAQNPINGMQRSAFEELRRLLPDAPASLANSSGIFLGTDFQYDLVRPGAALYGVNPTPGQDNPMRQVVGLQAKVIQTRELAIDIGIGYGHAYRTTTPLRTATIAIGYADGWPRRAGAAAWLDGIRLPFAGRVSMDSIVLDISALPPGRPVAGELVELIGPHQTVDDLAAIAGTIGYEVLTGLGGRFHRILENGVVDRDMTAKAWGSAR